MPRFENVIAAIDGSGPTEQMIHTLLSLPAFAKCNVTLLHAVPSQTSAEDMRAAWQKGQDLLARTLQSFPAQPGVKISTQLVEGDPKVVVLEVAESFPNPLIVMGSRGRNRIIAILQNSVSQYVFQLSSYPMLLVKDDAYVKQPNRVMVALNSSPSAQEALSTAMDLVSGIQGTQIFLARVQLDADNQSSDPVLDRAIETLKQRQISYRVFTAVGDPGTEIVRLAAESNADLLVMGSPDRRPTIARSIPDLDRLLGRSISDYVRVHIGCPVLMVRSTRDTE
ncbi:MAG: universal stress protein [Thermostichus sp. DG_1_6_bins_120]